MKMLNHWRPELPATLLLLSLLAGCSHIGTIRLGEDRPEDLNSLMETRQYERAEQLLNDFPYLDTPGQREHLHGRIAEYEQAAIVEAQALESGGNLYNALEVIDTALVDLPHSSVLNDYRRTLANKREIRLRDYQREKLISRAEYIVQQQQLYAEQSNLEAPGFGRRWTNTLHQQEASGLVDELQECGHTSLLEDDLVTADRCLQLARSIDESPDVQVALSSLADKQDSQRDNIEKKEQVKRVNKEKKQAIKRRNRTQELLASTGKALETNDLLAARGSFSKIPAGERRTPAVADMQARLDQAIDPVVTELLDKGDRLYRADKVDRAISSWGVALELDPDNSGIRERLERANKVLARLEELKSRQQQD
jgi:tetratricopeptide (TPR) repeat protein